MKVTSEGKGKENEVYIMTTNSSVESAKAGENERTGNDFCYFLDKKFLIMESLSSFLNAFNEYCF